MQWLSGDKFKKLKNALQKHWRVVIFLFAVLLILASQRDNLARTVWEKFRTPSIALLLNTNDPILAKEIGDHYFENRYNLIAAVKAYKEAAEINSRLPYAHYQLARVYFVEGRHTDAIKEINEELSVNSENFRAYYVRGLIYGYRLNLDKAEADFREFIKWAPGEWAGYNDLAWILLKRTKYQEAKEAIYEAFSAVPDADENPWLWNSLGVAALNLGEFASAERSFQNASRYAQTLTTEDWRRAYPGNNPMEADRGLAAFRDAIRSNRERATKGSSASEP